MSDVIERFLRSLVEHDWHAFESCLADDFTRVGPYGDTYSSKADYVAFLSDLMPTLAGYEMEVTRVSYADGVGFAELSETVEVDGSAAADSRVSEFRLDRRRADQPRRGVHPDARTGVTVTILVRGSGRAPRACAAGWPLGAG